MKKVKKFLLGNIKTVVAFVLGIIISGATVYATTILFASNEVSYDNTTSGLTSTNVQDAIDELYTKANSDSFWVKKYKTFVNAPQYYAFGEYKGWCSGTDRICGSFTDFPTTSTTPPTGKNVYAAKYADGQYGVCIKRNGTEHCFRGRNYTAESKHVQEVFSDINCDIESDCVGCDASDFSCAVDSDGFVSCGENSTDDYCFVDTDGSVTCN